jgi:hypothetical protein
MQSTHLLSVLLATVFSNSGFDGTRRSGFFGRVAGAVAWVVHVAQNKMT